jgi:hypothetical protein
VPSCKPDAWQPSDWRRTPICQLTLFLGCYPHSHGYRAASQMPPSTDFTIVPKAGPRVAQQPPRIAYDFAVYPQNSWPQCAAGAADEALSAR